jgi:ribonucleoside-triphosphate reductase
MCDQKTEVYSRVCGYFRPVSNWNPGKLEEFHDRKTYSIDSSTHVTEQKQQLRSF